jgi:hypothetical protein
VFQEGELGKNPMSGGNLSTYRQGWKKPGFFLKTQPSGFVWFFFYIAQKREFLGFFQFHFQEYFWVHPDFKLYRNHSH